MYRVRDVGSRGRALAARARTTLAVAPVLDVFVRGVIVAVTRHHVEPGGRVVLVVDAESPLVTVLDRRAGSVQVLVRAARVDPAQGPDRSRSRVELLGRLTGPPATGNRPLTLEPTHVSVDDLAVSVRRYRRAVPDPATVAQARREQPAPAADP